MVMAYREVLRLEIAEVVRRWQAGNSQRNIASGTGLSRDTVRKYLAAAKEAGVVQEGPAPTEDQLSRLAGINRSGPRQSETPSEELLGPWADQVYRWLNVERLQLTRIRELLAARGCQVAYSSLHRFIARRNWRGRSRGTVRMEDTAPGEVAELDFGRLGRILDPETGRLRTAWALIVVLAYSRHSFVWPTFSQKLEDVIAGLEAAWAFFGGIPRYLVIDNFPAAVAGADALHPRLTRGFLEYSQHRDFITDPTRVRHPKDKPHVERGVQYVRERFFKGGEFRDLAHFRAEAARWCRDIAGQRVHGTTRHRPLQVFQDEERQALAPRDGEPYEVTGWRTAKVHPDHHVACQYALYSVPSSLCPPGQHVDMDHYTVPVLDTYLAASLASQLDCSWLPLVPLARDMDRRRGSWFSGRRLAPTAFYPKAKPCTPYLHLGPAQIHNLGWLPLAAHTFLSRSNRGRATATTI